MKGRWIAYSAEELAWIEANAARPAPEMHAAFQAAFPRPDVTQVNLMSLRKRKGWRAGGSGRFQPGAAPVNKGRKMPFNENSARTRFRKGHEPHNTKYLGHERITKDGYVEVSIAEINPHTGYWRRYVHKHRHLWEQQNGPLPAGMCLKCLDGDATNTDPSNWEAVPRALLPRLNGRFGRGYDAAPAEIKPLILAVTKLENQVKRKRTPRKQDTA